MAAIITPQLGARPAPAGSIRLAYVPCPRPRPRHGSFVVRSSSDSGAPAIEKAPAADAPTASDASPDSNGVTPVEASPELEYVERSAFDRSIASLRLAFALPWRRFKGGSALVFKLGGAIPEEPQSRFSQVTSLPAICECLRKAAHDPRINGVVFKIDPLSVGWAKVIEIRRHLEYFRKSGKWTVAYMERAGEKEYYLASAFEEIYAPPCASLSLRGLSVAGTFLRGVLEKVGVEPEVRRIGKYKSAGDQLLRSDMSEPQREQLSALLDDIYERFTEEVAAARGKTREEFEALLNEGVYDMERFKGDGWVTDLKYEDELNDMIKARTGGKEDELRAVGSRKYTRVGRSALVPGGSKSIAILRTSGAIVAGSSSNGGSITAGAIISQLRSLKKNKQVAAVVLRVDSPGGDALASDLMWREIQELSKEKPVIASMADVAASGGYYMAMACQKIVAEALTITGSIGVVTGKFSLAELYDRVGYNKEVISRGRYAQLLAENKTFTEDEATLFDAAAQHAYEQFRDKAAASRGMDVEAMQEVAQGRVWSGTRAAEIGLVDALGGINRAIQLAKEAAGIPPEQGVTTLEVSRASLSPLALLTGGGASLQSTFALLQLVMGLKSGISPAAALGAPALMQALLGAATEGGAGTGLAALSGGDQGLVQGMASGRMMAQMPGVDIDGVGSKALLDAGLANASSSGSELFDC